MARGASRFGREGKMDTRLRKKNHLLLEMIPVILGLVIILMLYGSGLLRKRNRFPVIWASPGGDVRSVSSAAGQGQEIRGFREITLDAGTYTLSAAAAPKGGGELHLAFSRGGQPEPSVFRISPENGSREFTFHLDREARNLEVRLVCGEEGAPGMEELVLTTPGCTDLVFTCAGVWMAIGALWMARRRGRPAGRTLWALLPVAAAVVFASLPSLHGGLVTIDGHDGIFHLARLENLRSALMTGQVPARVGGFSYNGFGALTSVFYPDVFLYPFALMRMLGATQVYTVHVLFICIHLASGLSMFSAARRMTGNEESAACAAVFYVLALYRLSNLYIRFALGEALAMVFLPLFFEGIWRVAWDDGNPVTLGVSAACIFLSHMITTLLCAGWALGIFLVRFRWLCRNRRWLRIVQGGMLAGVLSLFQIVPFLMYSAQGIETQRLRRHVAEFVLRMTELLQIRGFHTLGPVMVLSAVLLCAAVIAGGRPWTKQKPGHLAIPALGMAAICVLLSVSSGFWNLAAKLTGNTTDYIQFPWRLLGFASVFLAFSGGCFLAGETGRRAAVIALVLCAAAAWPEMSAVKEGNVLMPGELGKNDLINKEYNLPGYEGGWTEDESIRVTGSARVEDARKKGPQMEMNVTAPEGGVISLPLFAFDGYAAQMDGERLPVLQGEQGRIEVRVPEHSSGKLKVWFAGKSIWRICDGISCLGWLGAAVYAVLKRRRGAGLSTGDV